MMPSALQTTPEERQLLAKKFGVGDDTDLLPISKDRVLRLLADVELLLAMVGDLAEYRAANESPGWKHGAPPYVGEKLSDAVVAGRVRMLIRSDLDHEAVCVMARDRILSLSRQVAALQSSAEPPPLLAVS